MLPANLELWDGVRQKEVQEGGDVCVPHLAKRWEPRGFSRVAAGFSSYDGDLSLPLELALGSPIFPSGCEGKLGVALESLQGRRDLT